MELLVTVSPRLFGSALNIVPASRVFGRKPSAAPQGWAVADTFAPDSPAFRAKVIPTVPAIAD